MRVAAEAMPVSGCAPAVSVIIATCGRPQFLLDCVASILRNDFQDFEIIIVDQARDRTLQVELGRRFSDDGRLVYVVLDQANLSRARNAGIKHARGDILVFADDDIEVEPGWLSAYREAFDAGGTELMMVGGRLDPLWIAPRPPWLPESKEYLLGIYNKHQGLLLMPEPDLPIWANFATHRKVVNTIGPFDERVGPSYARKRGMIFGDDSLFSLRARQARYPVYHHAAARAWHKMLPHKMSKTWFVRRCFWEGVTLLTVRYLAGTLQAEDSKQIIKWHVDEIARWTRHLGGTLAHWTRLSNPTREAMNAVSSMAQSAGVVRAAFKLRATGHLPW
jgi:glucosyl-dolichyl phosphate glucuronosyltransferase